MLLTISELRSPIGPLTLACDEAGGLRAVRFGASLERRMEQDYPDATRCRGLTPTDVELAFNRYFAGDIHALAHAPWSLDGATAESDLPPRVWRTLASVPAGMTTTYGEVAERMGDRTLARAVGAALNRNPLPLVLACHRVIGADGALVGFGGGLERKAWLLRHEGALLI